MKTQLHSEFFKTMTQLATSGFGLVAALAWNDMIKAFINRFISPGSTFASQIIYAILVTALAVIITYYLGKITQNAKELEEKGQKNA